MRFKVTVQGVDGLDFEMYTDCMPDEPDVPPALGYWVLQNDDCTEYIRKADVHWVSVERVEEDKA